MNKKILLLFVVVAGFAVSVPIFFAQAATATSTGTVAKIACVGAAVNLRETVLDSGLNAYVKAVLASYAARKIALKRAYATTTYAGAHAAAQAAWAGFGTSFESAVGNWTAVKSSTWAKFDVAIQACKTPTGTSDGADIVSGL